MVTKLEFVTQWTNWLNDINLLANSLEPKDVEKLFQLKREIQKLIEKGKVK